MTGARRDGFSAAAPAREAVDRVPLFRGRPSSSSGPLWLLRFSSGRGSGIRIGLDTIDGLARIPGSASQWGTRGMTVPFALARFHRNRPGKHAARRRVARLFLYGA